MNLKQILNRKAGDITAARAARLLSVGSKASDNYVQNLETEVEQLQERIEDLMDIDLTTDKNAGTQKLSNNDMKNLITKYHELSEELHLAIKKLAHAKEVNEDLKAEGPDLKVDEK